MNTKLLHFTILFRMKKKRQNIVTYQPHLATLTYSDKKTNKVTKHTIPSTISHIPVQKDTLG